MNRKRRASNQPFDEHEAFKKSCHPNVTEDVFITPGMTKFIEE